MATKKGGGKGTVTNVSSDGLEDAVVIITDKDGNEHRTSMKLVGVPAVGDEVTIPNE